RFSGYGRPGARTAFPTRRSSDLFDAIAKRAAEQGVSVKELHDILPSYVAAIEVAARESGKAADAVGKVGEEAAIAAQNVKALDRSEEHTSELQSRENLVCRVPPE